jgi:mevalonate kinase
MVSYVNALRVKRLAYYQRIFDENEMQTKRVTVALKEKNEIELIDAIRKGERTLEEMGVVSQKVIPLIRQIEKSGGAAKILGGGGRKAGVGYLLCYHQQIPPELSGQKITLGGEGVKLENHEP